MCESEEFNGPTCKVQCASCKPTKRRKKPMPDTEQFFIVTLQRMITCDEGEMSSGWSAVVAEKDLANFGNLKDAAILTKMELTEDSPFTNLRPMTEVEVKAWRENGNE
jgi:hypothetical protein